MRNRDLTNCCCAKRIDPGEWGRGWEQRGFKIVENEIKKPSGIVRPYILPRLHLPGSKPVLRDRCCDGMLEKRALLLWVEAHDLPRRGARDIEKGASGTVFSTHPHQKPPDTTTTASRNNTVISPHLGKIYDTFILHQEHHHRRCF